MSDIRTADEAAIRATLEDSYRAWASGDADGMVAAYTDDASAILPGSLRDNREVIRQSMAVAFAGPLKGTSTYNKQLGVRFLGATRCSKTMRSSRPSGPPALSRLRAEPRSTTIVLQPSGGRSGSHGRRRCHRNPRRSNFSGRCGHASRSMSGNGPGTQPAERPVH